MHMPTFRHCVVMGVHCDGVTEVTQYDHDAHTRDNLITTSPLRVPYMYTAALL